MLKDILQDITLRLCKIKELRYVASKTCALGDEPSAKPTFICALVGATLSLAGDFTALPCGAKSEQSAGRAVAKARMFAAAQRTEGVPTVRRAPLTASAKREVGGRFARRLGLGGRGDSVL